MPTEPLVKTETVSETLKGEDFAAIEAKIVAKSPVPLTPSESRKRSATFEPIQTQPKRRNAGATGSGEAVVAKRPLLIKSERSGADSPYNTRTKSGHVEITLNEHLPNVPQADDLEFSSEGCDVHILSGVRSERRFMHTTTAERTGALERSLLDIAEKIRSHYALPLFSGVGKVGQEEIVVCGRVRAERFPGEASGSRRDVKLSEKQGIFLEGSLEHSNGAMVKLDVSSVPRLSLFRGQAIVVKGICSSSGVLNVKRIWTGVPPTAPAADLPASAASASTTIWAAAGPFTLPSDLEFLPLQDLLKQMKDAKPRPPDALVLMGPFVPESHAKVANGDVVLDFDGEKYEASFSELFHLKLATLVSDFIAQTGCKTRILLAPSVEDVHHTCVYPQPPFKASLFESEDGMDLAHGGQVVCLPNPALVRVGGVVVAINTADLPVHLIRSGDVNRWEGNQRPHRFERFADHVLQQRNFYPLYPADKSVPLDPAFYSDLEMTVKPDVMLTRSNLSYFAKSTSDDSLFVNPGMLARHSTGGTFAKLVVQPAKNVVKNEATKTSGDGTPAVEPVARRTRVDIQRV